MRPHGDVVPQRLLDRRPHRLPVARVTSARNIRRRDEPQQRLLRTVGNRFRRFSHVAIQIHLGPNLACALQFRLLFLRHVLRRLSPPCSSSLALNHPPRTLRSTPLAPPESSAPPRNPPPQTVFRPADATAPRCAGPP